MQSAYLGGPMRGYTEQNGPAFREAFDLLSPDFKVISPWHHDDGEGFDWTDTEGLPAASFAWDVEQVCLSDQVILLPGWPASEGCRIERSVAHLLGKPVFYFFTDESDQGYRLVPEKVGDPRFHALLHEMGTLHDRKQTDYGTDGDAFANVRASEDFGIPAWIGCLMRLNDKVTRLQNFAQKGSLANESAEDSMLDIAVYAIIALVLYREASA